MKIYKQENKELSVFLKYQK